MGAVYRGVVSLLLLASLVLSIMAFPVHGDGLRQDVIEWALQNAVKPDWMPPLEEYKPLVESVVNVSLCQAKINYVGVYYGSERAYNESLGAYVHYAHIFDLLRFRALSMLVNERNLAGILWFGIPEDLEHGVLVSRSPIFLIELDEELFNKGYLFAKTIYVRLNETHIGNLTAFMHILFTQFPVGVTNFTVYCPAPQTRVGLATTVTETITETVTQVVTIPIPVTETYSTTTPVTVLATETVSVPFTITITERETHTYSYPVTETITSVVEKTKTVTEMQTLLSTITEPRTVTIKETGVQVEVFIPALIIALAGLITGWVLRKK